MEGKRKEIMVREDVKSYLVPADYKANLSLMQAWRKWRAVEAHKSQGLGRNIWVPNLLLILVFRTEYFSLVEVGKNYAYEYVSFEI